MRQLLVIAVLFFSSCISHITRDPGILVRELLDEPNTLNPYTYTEESAAQVIAHIYESLLTLDNQTLRLKPWIAESWEVSANGKEYTFHLRKDVKWSDGLPLTVNDVVFSLQRLKDPKTDDAAMKVYYRDVDRIEVVDPHTVRFIYKRLYFRALEVCGGMPIIPRHIFDNGMEFNSHPANTRPVGTGPYQLTKWEKGRYILLERNPHYWNTVPQVTGVQFLIIPDMNTAFQMLKKGGLDLMLRMRPVQWMRQTASSKFGERFEKFKFFPPGLNYIAWNHQRPQFSDKRVRQALSMLLDRPKIAEKIAHGQARLISGIEYFDGPAYDHSVKPWPYDPGRAVELLDEAGWRLNAATGMREKDGVPFRFAFMYASGSQTGERIGSIFREALSDVGINMELRPTETSVFQKLVVQHDFDALTMAWAGGAVESDGYQLFHSSQIEKGSNFVGFSNSHADELMLAIGAELNLERRKKLHSQLHALIHEEEPYTFLYSVATLAAVDRRFTNVITYPLGFDTTEWGFKPVIRYME